MFDAYPEAPSPKNPLLSKHGNSLRKESEGGNVSVESRFRHSSYLLCSPSDFLRGTPTEEKQLMAFTIAISMRYLLSFFQLKYGSASLQPIPYWTTSFVATLRHLSSASERSRTLCLVNLRDHFLIARHVMHSSSAPRAACRAARVS